MAVSLNRLGQFNYASDQSVQLQLDRALQRIYRSDTPQSAANPVYSYSQTAEDKSIYIIYPHDEPGYSFLVSESYLSIVLHAAGGNNEAELSALSAYSSSIQQLGEHIMRRSYPDSSVVTEPFDSVSIDQYRVEQDPLADPYVRITTSEGVQYSIAKDVALRVLQDQKLSPSMVVEQLNRFAYRLPEASRITFGNLDHDDIVELATATPRVAEKEFMMMQDVTRNYEQAVMGSFGPAYTPSIPIESTIQFEQGPIKGPETSILYKISPKAQGWARDSLSSGHDRLEINPAELANHYLPASSNEKVVKRGGWGSIAINMICFGAGILFLYVLNRVTSRCKK